MGNFAAALKENSPRRKKPKLADIDVGSLSSATEGKLFEGDIAEKKDMAFPREPQRGATEKTFQFLRGKLKKDPKNIGYRDQMKDFLKINPSFKSAK